VKAVPSPPFNPTAYRLAGLRIVSDLPLAGLIPCRDTTLSGTEISIRRADVPKSLPSIGTTFPNGQCNANELLLNIPQVARYLLRGGSEILVDPVQDANHDYVCGYLLGTVFGLLCYQRGLVPLHASAIDIENSCIAFVGESGAGKSTLVAALAARGHQVIADDVCYLKSSESGSLQAWPGINRIRLWEDAMIALGCNGPGVEREITGFNKYCMPVPSPSNPIEPRSLRRVYQLCPAPSASSASAKRLLGADALEALMQNVYRLGLAEYTGYKPAAFVICAAAARDIPIYRFSRPMEFNVLPKAIAFLEDHFCEIC
jgi:hypothetical protein